MILLEQLTRGACFEGVNANAFLIHVLANGVALPDDLDPQLHLRCAACLHATATSAGSGRRYRPG